MGGDCGLRNEQPWYENPPCTFSPGAITPRFISRLKENVEPWGPNPRAHSVLSLLMARRQSPTSGLKYRSGGDSRTTGSGTDALRGAGMRRPMSKKRGMLRWCSAEQSMPADWCCSNENIGMISSPPKKRGIQGRRNILIGGEPSDCFDLTRAEAKRCDDAGKPISASPASGLSRCIARGSDSGAKSARSIEAIFPPLRYNIVRNASDPSVRDPRLFVHDRVLSRFGGCDGSHSRRVATRSNSLQSPPLEANRGGSPITPNATPRPRRVEMLGRDWTPAASPRRESSLVKSATPASVPLQTSARSVPQTATTSRSHQTFGSDDMLAVISSHLMGIDVKVDTLTLTLGEVLLAVQSKSGVFSVGGDCSSLHLAFYLKDGVQLGLSLAEVPATFGEQSSYLDQPSAVRRRADTENAESSSEDAPWHVGDEQVTVTVQLISPFKGSTRSAIACQFLKHADVFRWMQKPPKRYLFLEGFPFDSTLAISVTHSFTKLPPVEPGIFGTEQYQLCCDVMVRVGKRHVPVSRYLLSNASPYFRALLKERVRRYAFFPSSEAEAIQQLLNLVHIPGYQGLTKLNLEILIKVFEAAIKYRFDNLIDRIALQVASRLNSVTAKRIARTAKATQHPILRVLCELSNRERQELHV